MLNTFKLFFMYEPRLQFVKGTIQNTVIQACTFKWVQNHLI
jgi:hypothetical protein